MSHVYQQNQSDSPIVFFKHEVIMHHVYALEGRIINQCACLQVLRDFVCSASYTSTKMGQMCSCILSPAFWRHCSGIEELLAIPKAGFMRCYQHWHKQCTKCLHAEGASFEACLPFL
jgi:hypothetical protein